MPDVFAIAEGDVFRLEKLLDLAGLDLDTSMNFRNESLREAGTQLEIEVFWENLKPFWSTFGYHELRYSYRVVARPWTELKSEVLHNYQGNYPQERITLNRHGIRLVVTTVGQVGIFNLSYLIVLLVSTGGLLQAARIATTYLGKWSLKRQEFDMYVTADRGDGYEAHDPHKFHAGTLTAFPNISRMASD